MKNDEAALLLQCHCPALPGTEDPRIVKAVRAAEKDPALKTELARQRAFDERQMAALEQVTAPHSLLGKLAAAQPAAMRAGKGALMQPVVIAILIGALVLVGWGGVTLWNRAHSFPGKDSAMRIVEVNDEMTGMEMEPRKELAGELDDWFFDKYGFEDYYLPPGFENYHAVGARLFKQDDGQVAQVAIEENNMIFFSFKADDFGVALPTNDQWRVFTDGDWAAGLIQHDDECFMVTFRGSAADMDDFLKGKN
ncbi:MAG: hypothetical protein ABSE62_04585 [Chthoniobacteraceae bacterium]